MKFKPFTKKTITVQDYPDPKFKIQIFGTSSTSKYKLNDTVVFISNRTGCKIGRVIGFDEAGDLMIDSCSWCNTRGGYKDKDLIPLKKFKKIISHVKNTRQSQIAYDLKRSQKFDKEYKIPKKRSTEVFIHSYIVQHLQKLIEEIDKQ